MAAKSSDYRDPAEVLERKQEPKPTRSCVGCRFLHVKPSRFDNRNILVCEMGMQVGQRCQLFEGKS